MEQYQNHPDIEPARSHTDKVPGCLLRNIAGIDDQKLRKIEIGGIWLWYFFGQLAKRPLVPVMDPFLENAIKHGHGH